MKTKIKPKYKLRDYQQEGVERILHHFKKGSEKDVPVIVAPTAAGKSIYIANVVHELKSGVLVLQPSKELLEQNYEKYTSYGGEASIYSASVGEKEIGPVTFATIGSVLKIPHLFVHVKYVIIDECHLVPPEDGSMYMKFLKSLIDVRVVGLTATAFRLKKYRDPFTLQPYSQINLITRERPRFFNSFAHITQIKDLYAKGYLAKITPVEMAWSDGELKVNSTGAEYTEDSMDLSMKQQKIYERLPSILQQSVKKGRKHRLVFVKNVTDGIMLTKKVPDSACVHAGTKKKDREIILNDFKSGKIKTVFNVGVLTVGFDFPALDVIIMARPTMSLILYMQIIGRGMRKEEGKEDCVFVDMCGNIERFGMIENIEYTIDEKGGWIIHNGIRQLSGVPLNKK